MQVFQKIEQHLTKSISSSIENGENSFLSTSDIADVANKVRCEWPVDEVFIEERNIDTNASASESKIHSYY